MMVSPAICLAHTTITVNSLADPSDSGKCTLRDAINLALSPPMSTDCVTSGTGTPFTIVFDASLAGGTILLGSALPTITSPTDLTITGPSTSSAGITIDGNAAVRAMKVDSGATLTLQYLTLQNGKVVGDPVTTGVGGGAGIFNEGALTISNSTLSGNSADSPGGAIYNGGTATISGSTLSGNSAISTSGGATASEYEPGGGIANDGTLTVTNSTFSDNSATLTAGGILNGGTLTVTNSTFSGNSAPLVAGGIYNDGTVTVTNSTFSDNSTLFGGGIYNDGTLTVTNSTFSGNSTVVGVGVGVGVGGGILNEGTVTVTNSTFSGNSAGGGGGIYNDGGTVNLKGTILAASTPDNCEGGANPTDVGYNISDDATCGFSATGSANNLNPMLAALADNGGPTETIALQAGSPAIDAILVADCTDQASPTPNPITTDQRGMPRPDAGEGVCDIGAYEFQDLFAGTPGATNCHGRSVSALSNQYGTLDAAASALGYPSVKALQKDIEAHCAG
jgi:CSLREA domain-containing protein